MFNEKNKMNSKKIKNRAKIRQQDGLKTSDNLCATRPKYKLTCIKCGTKRKTRKELTSACPVCEKK